MMARMKRWADQIYQGVAGERLQMARIHELLDEADSGRG